MKITLILLSLALLSSCGLPDIRINRQVSAGEIVGTWVLDPQSSAIVGSAGARYEINSGTPHLITFREDGTCRYRSVLQMPTRYVDCQGEWRIISPPDNPKGSEIELTLKTGIRETYIFRLNFKEESGKLILWEFWGDPDLWLFLEYRRKETEQGAAANP